MVFPIACICIFDNTTGLMETIENLKHLPALKVNQIHIWGIHVPEMMDKLDALQAVLCANERDKASRFRREADRISSIAARGALRILISGYTGIPVNFIIIHNAPGSGI